MINEAYMCMMERLMMMVMIMMTIIISIICI